MTGALGEERAAGSCLAQARAAAADCDVIVHGAATAQALLSAGLNPRDRVQPSGAS